MKLHQLRYLAAVAQSGLNITAAAHKLHTSQPGVSKQIKLLEDELGFQVFVREGRNLTRITPAGQQVIERALKILQEAQSIRAIATGSEALFAELTLLPCYRWYRTVIVPRGHALANGARLSFKALAAYPLITYTFSFTGPSSLHEAFAKAALTPNIAITARDADVIQTYVRLGLGVGIVAHMAVDEDDPDLAGVDASHLFAAHTTWIGFRRGTLLRKYMYDFAQLLAPHLDRRLIERAHRAASADEVAQLFADIALPLR